MENDDEKCCYCLHNRKRRMEMGDDKLFTTDMSIDVLSKYDDYINFLLRIKKI